MKKTRPPGLLTEKNQKELGLVVSQADGDSSSGNIVVILRVVVLLFFVEKRLEKRGKKVDGKKLKRIRPNGRHFRNLQVEKRFLPNFQPSLP